MNPYNPANNPQAGGTAFVPHLNDDAVSRQRRRGRGEEEGSAVGDLVRDERGFDEDKVSGTAQERTSELDWEASHCREIHELITVLALPNRCTQNLS
jgi:hypothetical protein